MLVVRPFDDLFALGIVIAGDPASVRGQVLAQVRETGRGFLCFGNLKPGRVLESEPLFACEVFRRFTKRGLEGAGRLRPPSTSNHRRPANFGLRFSRKASIASR
jgi:hypothetical protein